MKKVVCIDDSSPINYLFGGPNPNYGDILTVSWEGDYKGVYTYCFIEYGDDFGYSAKRFAPLSEKDETEFIRNYNKQLV